MWLHHKGCTSPLVEYVGQYPIYANPRMKRHEWRDLDGQEFIGAKLPTLVCPCCGNEVKIHSDYLASFDGTPVAFGLEVHAAPKREAQQSELTAWLWFRQLIT
jgi:hypothetical protein